MGKNFLSLAKAVRSSFRREIPAWLTAMELEAIARANFSPLFREGNAAAIGTKASD